MQKLMILLKIFKSENLYNSEHVCLWQLTPRSSERVVFMYIKFAKELWTGIAFFDCHIKPMYRCYIIPLPCGNFIFCFLRNAVCLDEALKGT